MNLYKDKNYEDEITLFFNNKDIIKYFSISNESNEIKLSEELTKLLYFYFINELIYDTLISKKINFKDYVSQNLKFLDELFYFLLDKVISKNIIGLITEFSEYFIYEGYNEIISLFYYNIKHEDIEFKEHGKKLELDSKNKKNIKKNRKKINKILNRKINV